MTGSSAACKFHRGEYSAGLVHALVEFTRRVRVSDDARPGLQIGAFALHQHGPDRDAGVEVSGEVGVENRTPVDATANRFEFLDDLHGTNFRGTGEGAG